MSADNSPNTNQFYSLGQCVFIEPSMNSFMCYVLGNRLDGISHFPFVIRPAQDYSLHVRTCLAACASGTHLQSYCRLEDAP